MRVQIGGSCRQWARTAKPQALDSVYARPNILQSRKFLFEQLVGLSCKLHEDFYAYLL
jgi:hypothetical protein